MAELKLEPDAVSGDRNMTVDMRSEFVSASPSSFPSYRAPLFVSRAESYYWTYEWQHDEREALMELERGEGKVFQDPEQAVRWLMEPEDK
jgi:hypothetical protein